MFARLFIAIGSLLGATGTASAALPLEPGLAARLRIECPLAVERAPIEAAMLADAADGVLDAHTLHRAALLASGVHDRDQLERYERLLDAHGQALRAEGVDRLRWRLRAAVVHQYLAVHVLRGEYRVHAGAIDRLWQQGDYNCVGATIAFNCLAREVGLQTWAVLSPGHVHSRVELDGLTLDIETTNRQWPLPGRESSKSIHGLQNRSVTNLEVRLTAARNGDSDGRRVGEVELVGMLYYNRGIQLLEAGQFAAAVDANLCALACDPQSGAAYDNLLASLNNWALDACQRGAFDESLRLLELGLALEPASDRLLANRSYLHDRWAAAMVEQGEREAAVVLLRGAAEKWPDELFFRRKADWLESQAYLPQ